MRRLAVCAVLLTALAVVACDAGTKPTSRAGPGPRLHFASPRMDATFALTKTTTKDKDGKETIVEEAPTIEVMFDLRNYDDRQGRGGRGPHLHLILDNEPYQAIYDVSRAIELDKKLLTKGTHILRAFPSAGPNDAEGRARARVAQERRARSRGCASTSEGRAGDLAIEFDPAEADAHLQPPQGRVRRRDAEPPEVHGRLVPDELVARQGRATTSPATPRRQEVVGYVGRVEAVQLETPPAAGDHVLKLELLDRDDKPVLGPFNSTERKFKVVEKKR